MSYKITSSNKILKSHNFNNFQTSNGISPISSLDNQRICTCGKWRFDTQRSYYGTIESNLRSDDYCTCDDDRYSKNMSLCNCNKRYIGNNIERNCNSNFQTISVEDYNNERKILNRESTNSNINAKVCTCGKAFLNRNMNINLNSIQTTDSEERIIKKEIKDNEININTEAETDTMWTGDIFIQVIERLQYLAMEPPELSVQFMNDMMINPTINFTPIRVLLPIPDNYIQKQAILDVRSKEEKEEEKNINEELCPENVDLLNISKAYSIPIPSFDNLTIENHEMLISSSQIKTKPITKKIIKPKPKKVIKPKIEQKIKPKPKKVIKPKIEQKIKSEPKKVIKPKIEQKIKSEQKIKPKPKKVIKPKIEQKIKTKSEPKMLKKVEKKNLEIENNFWNISPTERKWNGPIKIVKTNKFDIEENEKNWNELIKKETADKFEVMKKKKEKFNYLTKNKFELKYKDSGKIFKTIDISDNKEISLLTAQKDVNKNSPTEVSNLSLGGKGFVPRVWSPAPYHANSMTLQKGNNPNLKIISTDMAIPPAYKRRDDWNLVNIKKSENPINIITEEKILVKKNMPPLTIINKSLPKNKWNDIIKREKCAKMVFKSCNKIGNKNKKWILSIMKENDFNFIQETDEVIINDDYNAVYMPQMRPINVTILKMRDNEETSSESSLYDVFHNIIVKKNTLDIKMKNDGNINFKSRFGFLNNKDEFKKNIFGGQFNNKFENRRRLRTLENKEKNKYDIMRTSYGNERMNLESKSIREKRRKIKNIEFIREEPGVHNFLKI